MKQIFRKLSKRWTSTTPYIEIEEDDWLELWEAQDPKIQRDFILYGFPHTVIDGKEVRCMSFMAIPVILKYTE